jgi:hypothetical protein
MTARSATVARYDKSVAIGAVVSAVLVGIAFFFRHARLEATAAQQHQTVPQFLLVAFLGMTLVITVVVYLIASLAVRS